MRDLEWLVPVAVIVAAEFILWWIAFAAGIAFAPMLGRSGMIAFSLFAFVLLIALLLLIARMAIQREAQPLKRLMSLGRENLSRFLLAIVAIQLLTMSASAFAALKAGIPKTFPFWLDTPLMKIEHGLFGLHPWELSYLLFGPVTPWIDKIYATFVPLQTLALVLAAAAKPSHAKSRAIVTIALAWLILGVFGAYLLSSAGPIFYDRVFGGDTFGGLIAMLAREAPMALHTSDVLWESYHHDVPIIVNGISAMPSMHVAGTFWFALVVQGTRFAPLAWLYFALIWLGSVHLGWHYASDGLVSVLVVLGLWKLAPKLLFRPKGRQVEAPATAA